MAVMKNYCSILIVLLVTHSAFCQTNPVFDGIDTFIDSVMTRWSVPGLALAVVKDGKIVYKKGYGYRNLKTKEKITPFTLFSIASSTKSFTSTAAAILVDEKKLDFDTPLKEYFPDFQMYDPAATDKLTMRDLLCHRSGTPRQKFFSLNTPPTRQEVRTSMRYFEPARDFRSLFQYCNETITVAGDMIAERAGIPWEELIRTRIFEPVGMKHSIFSVRDVVKTPDYALPYIDWEEGKPEEMEFHNADILGPAGCMISNVEDLSKWVLFNLNKGKVDDKQIVSSQNLARLQSPQIPVSQRMKYPEVFYQSYGMGWFIDAYRGNLHVHHGGVLYGFTSQVSFLPTANIGVVLLANLNGTPATEVIEYYIYDKLLGLEPVDWQKRKLDELAQMKVQYEKTKDEKDPDFNPESPLTSPLNNFTGTYISNGYGSMTIQKEGDSLHTVLLGIRCPLRHYNNETFDIYHPVEHQGWRITFQQNSPDGVSAFTLQLGIPGVKDILYTKRKDG